MANSAGYLATYLTDIDGVEREETAEAIQALVEKRTLSLAQTDAFALRSGGNLTSSSDVQNLVSTAAATDYWHFGAMVLEPATGRMHWWWRSAIDHLLEQSLIKYAYSDDMGATLFSYDAGGAVVSGPSTVFTSPAGRDYRDISAGIAPDGTIFVCFTDVPISASTSSIFKLCKSTDGAKTYTALPDVVSLPGKVGRVRGRIKVIPGKGKRRIVLQGWKQISSSASVDDVNQSLLYYSDDMGATPFAAGTPPFTGGSENETEAAFWANTGVAIARKNSGAMSCAVTLDYGASWTKLSDVANSVAGDVAPTVDILKDSYGKVWVLVGAAARATDTMRWWWARLKDVLASGGAAFTTFKDVATDMQALSGYHCPQILPSGEMSVFEVKEDNVGGRVLRNRRILPDKFFASERPWTPVISFTTPGDLAVTYSSQVGLWVQNGRQVTAYFALSTSAFTWTTASGSLLIKGLPVPSANAANIQMVCGGLEFAGITKTGMTSIACRVQQNGTDINFRSSGSGVVAGAIDQSHVPTGAGIRLLGLVSYMVDD